MKLKTAGIILVWLASVGFACASTNDITTLVQKGLFEEEANHHLDAAIDYYQEAIGRFDKDRQLTATAIFRLGECYRLQGKTNEANVQYQRIVIEFSDQAPLVELSRGYLPKENARSSFVNNLTKIPGGAIVGGGGPNPATLEGQEEMQEIRRIKDMIQNSPDLIDVPQTGNSDTPLVEAAGQGWMLAAKLLVDNGVTVNPNSPTRWTPLGRAADAGNKGMVEFLISKGANINALGGYSANMYANDPYKGWSPLHYAIDHGFKTVAETLLAHGADADVPNHRGDRPLHIAAERGYTTLAELLLAHKADVNAPGKGGETALFRAVQNNYLAMVQFLVSNKANVNMKSESGYTPLLRAAGRTAINIEIVKALLDSGADVEATAETHHALGIAVMQDRADLVELLLQKNADANSKGQWNLGRGGRAATPLLLAISGHNESQPKISAMLLQHGADPNLADENGETPVDYAISRANTNIIGDLIAHHADVNAIDKQGDPPLAYVPRFVSDPKLQEQTRSMLIQAGANEDYVRREAIFITQKGTGSIGRKVFSKGSDSVNRYTLFELIATAYQGGGDHGGIAFPDFAHVTINRLKAGGNKEEIAVKLNEMLQSGDCSKNPWLEWGDIVLIPQLDHKVGENWNGLTPSERETLGKCLMRKVKVVVKGQTTEITLMPEIVQSWAISLNGNNMVFSGGTLGAGLLNGESVLYDFDLNQVVHGANVLLISSDLSRVKVTRRESEAGGHPLVMEFNLETKPPPDFALRDGDVIEIPERDQK